MWIRDLGCMPCLAPGAHVSVIIEGLLEGAGAHHILPGQAAISKMSKFSPQNLASRPIISGSGAGWRGTLGDPQDHSAAMSLINMRARHQARPFDSQDVASQYYAQSASGPILAPAPQTRTKQKAGLPVIRRLLGAHFGWGAVLGFMIDTSAVYVYYIAYNIPHMYYMALRNSCRKL